MTKHIELTRYMSDGSSHPCHNALRCVLGCLHDRLIRAKSSLYILKRPRGPFLRDLIKLDAK